MLAQRDILGYELSHQLRSHTQHKIQELKTQALDYFDKSVACQAVRVG